MGEFGFTTSLIGATAKVPGPRLVGSTDSNVGTKDTHINFGEGLDDIDWEEAGEYCSKADLCIVMGTSMTLPHVVHFPFMAKKTVIVNLQVTPHDHRCHMGLRLWGTCDDVLQRLFRHLGLQVEAPPPWRPKHAVALAELERMGFPEQQLALARHIEKAARQREHAAENVDQESGVEDQKDETLAAGVQNMEAE